MVVGKSAEIAKNYTAKNTIDGRNTVATPGFVVRGRGSAPSLNSASHGAGRTMSRTAAKEKFRWSHVKPTLEAAGQSSRGNSRPLRGAVTCPGDDVREVSI